MKKIVLEPGVRVVAGGRRLELLTSKSPSKLAAKDIITGEIVSVKAADIEFEISEAALRNEPASNVGERKVTVLEQAGDAELELAARRFDVLRPLAGQKLTTAVIERISKELSVSASQVYRLIAKLDLDAGFVSLIPQKRGRMKGQNLISGDAEDIIREVVDSEYNGKGATLQSVVDKVNAVCGGLGISPPSESTIRQRVKSANPKDLLKKVEGAKAASQAYDVRGGKILLSHPLELMQIDHAVVDCFIVDDKERLPLGRPWATLAIDVFTRSVIGLHLSLAHPSAMSVALCIAHAVLPKDWWLKKYGIEEVEYPFYGVPQRIHVDNAREFKSQNLNNSCRLYDIKLTYRPPGKPYNGAHIERLIGTLMRKVHMLPGTTMSSIKERGEYDSQKHAALTFSEFRDWFITEVEIYHKKKHSELGCSPLLKWEQHFSKSDGTFAYPAIIEDRLRLLINFMPSKRRVVNRSGIRIHNIDYYSSSLKRFNIRHRCLVRYDPESLSRIWILPEGEKEYIELGYSDVRLPDTTLSEFRHARKKLAQESERRVTPEQVFSLIKRNEALVRSSVKQTKQARKDQERKRIRQSDAAHPLNFHKTSEEAGVSIDYSRKPKLFDVEE